MATVEREKGEGKKDGQRQVPEPRSSSSALARASFPPPPSDRRGRKIDSSSPVVVSPVRTSACVPLRALRENASSGRNSPRAVGESSKAQEGGGARAKVEVGAGLGCTAGWERCGDTYDVLVGDGRAQGVGAQQAALFPNFQRAPQVALGLLTC